MVDVRELDANRTATHDHDAAGNFTKHNSLARCDHYLAINRDARDMSRARACRDDYIIGADGALGTVDCNAIRAAESGATADMFHTVLSQQ